MIANNLLVSGSTTHLNPIKVTTSGQTTTDTMAFVSSAGASSRSGFGAIRTDTGLKTFFGTNVGGDRIGIYDDKNSKWILRADASGNITYSGGNVEDCLTATVTGQNAAATSAFVAKNTIATERAGFGIVKSSTSPARQLWVGVSADTTNKKGLYDDNNSKWMIWADDSGNVGYAGGSITGSLNMSVAGGSQFGVTNTSKSQSVALTTTNNDDSGAGVYSSSQSKWLVKINNSGQVTLPGTADTANQVQSSVVNDTPSQAYSAIPFTQTSLTETGAKVLSHSSNAFGFMASSTAAGTEGYAILVLGNNIAQATANNKRARLRLYGNTTYFHDIYAGTSAQTGNISLTLPNGASGGWLVGAASSGVGGSAIPVYVNSSGVVTACKVNGNGSWHNSGVAFQAGAVLEIGQYIDFHNSTSTNDYDVRLSAGTTRNSLNVAYPVAPSAAGILRNIQISTTDLTAGSSSLTNGYVYLVYE